MIQSLLCSLTISLLVLVYEKSFDKEVLEVLEQSELLNRKEKSSKKRTVFKRSRIAVWMHIQLYTHLVACINKRPITSQYQTSNPSELLTKMLSNLIGVENPQDRYHLRFFWYFLDIANNEQKSYE